MLYLELKFTLPSHIQILTNRSIFCTTVFHTKVAFSIAIIYTKTLGDFLTALRNKKNSSTPYKNGSVVDVHRMIFRNSNMIDPFKNNIFEPVILSKVLYFKENKLKS